VCGYDFRMIKLEELTKRSIDVVGRIAGMDARIKEVRRFRVWVVKKSEVEAAIIVFAFARERYVWFFALIQSFVRASANRIKFKP